MFNKFIGRVCVLVITLCILTTYHSFAATIVLDPGHGGSNPGAIGVNRLPEKDVNFAVTLKLREMLNEMGYNVLLTRESDVDMSLEARVQFKEKHRADLFVSIHANAHRDANAQGSLVLYYDHRYPNVRYPASPEMAALSETNRQFAQTVLNGLLVETQYVDQGIVPSSVYVVRNGTMPSILVELAFLSNWEDATRLADDKERELMARGIANGIEAFWPLGVFRDIASHWAASSITRIQEQGIVNGVGQHYYPDRALTRAEFLTMMDRVFHFSTLDVIDEQTTKGVDEETHIDNRGNTEDGIDHNIETDRDESIERGIDIDPHWAYETITKAAELGIIRGYPDGTIRPDAPISRAEVSVIFDRIWQAEHLDDPSVDIDENEQEVSSLAHIGVDHEQAGSLNVMSVFRDVPSDQWYTDSVHRLVRASLIRGITETQFAPLRHMTRAEIATIIDRFFTHQLSEIHAKRH